MKVVFLRIFIASLQFSNAQQKTISTEDLIASCRSPLGIESGVIPDNGLLASPAFGGDVSTYGPQKARLHLNRSGYRAATSSLKANETWIEVKLAKETIVTGISTQGHGDTTLNEWVTKYSLMFSTGSDFFHFKETNGAIKNFNGNSDNNGVQHHNVPLPVITSSIMVRPLDWNNNVGLRMELYGCKPGYYFLARFLIPEEYASFTLLFLDKESEDYRTWSADTMDEINHILQYVPGFLAVKFRRFRPSTDLNPLLVTVSAEVEIHCIEEAAQFIADTLVDSVGLANSMFSSNIDFVYPVNSNCSFPEVDIHLNKSITAATEVLTTSNVIFRADITLCGSQIKSIQSSLWDIFMIMDKTFLMPFLTIHNRTEHLFDTRFCPDCYPADMYVRFAANVKQLKGRTLENFGLLKINRPALVARIRGPKEAKKGSRSDILLNASDSHDPDKLSEGTLRFTWSCKRKKDEDVFKGECQHGRTEGNGRLFVVDVNSLKSKHTYDFKLTVSKRNRTNSVIHELKIHPSVHFTFRCSGNCGNKTVQSKRMTLTPECEGKLCKDIAWTRWSIRAQEDTRFGKLWNRIAQQKRPGLSPPQGSFVLRHLTSHSNASATRDPVYKLKATIGIRLENYIIIEEEHIMEVHLNSKPFSGWCFVDPDEGFAVETTFNITCVGWKDEDMDRPLKYEFRYNTSVGLVINNPNEGTGVHTLSTKLPVGNRSQNFQFPVDINIKDSLGDLTVHRVYVKVRDKYSGDINKTVYRIAYKKPNKVNLYIEKEDYAKACDLAISVLSVVEERKHSSHLQGDDGQKKVEFSKGETKKIKDNIIEQIKHVKINSKELMSKVSTVVAMATNERDEISQESQEEALRLLDEATDFLSKLMTNNTEEADTLSKEVSQNMLLGLGNILKISSEDASVIKQSFLWGQSDKYKKKSKDIAQKALKTIWKLRDCLVVNAADDKLVVITSGFLCMVLYRQTNIERMTEVENTKFTLPSYEGLFGEQGIDKTDITSKVVLFKSNPYTWHKSASTVKSWVVDVVLQKEDKTNLNVSWLINPVNLYIPQNSDRASPRATSGNTVQHFVKPSYDANESTLIQYHKINLTHDRAVVFVKLNPEISTYTPLRVYVSFSDLPTPTKHNFSTVIPRCGNVRNKNMEVDCIDDPKNYEFSFTAADTGQVGIHYIGIHYYVMISYDAVFGKENRTRSSDDEVAKERIRRSCGGVSGRKKRSCVGVKDPPPLPTPSPIVLRPSYNFSTDTKYNLTVNIGSCLYWSEDKGTWTDEGCNVTSDVVSGSIHCLCNHLSAFGGDFFLAPNEIDFRKVFRKFADLEESKNVVVMTTVCTMLLLYVIGLIVTRRADKGDMQKSVPNVYLPDGEEHGVYHYRISVATGMWMGSGTTANVGLMIYGEDCCSERIILNDSTSKKTFFARASVNTFSLSLPRRLGPLYKIRVWHDNTGESPGWFLLDVMITELESHQTWYFVANRWLAVDKASGELEAQIKASNKQDASKFKNLFYSRASKRLADGHLWISVLARPPQSSFTRTQRLSCCMSVLFSAMITNAMFYKIGEEVKDTFQLGPLTMSWTQVRIGIQSAMITLPVNAIIVAIFRNVKPKKQKNRNRNPEQENSPKGLPHFVIYIAWILCILVILSSAFFTVLFSMSWGKKISNEWLTSILISFFQDVIVSQPIQVVLIASLLSILIRKPIKHDPVHGLPHRKNQCENDARVQPPEEEELKKSRTFWMTLHKIFRSVVEIIFFGIFVLLLFVVCYGNRDTSRYRLTRSLKDIFVAFDKRVNSTPTFWNWTRERLVPGVYFSEWYNGRQVELDEGFISSGYPFLVGMPRLRQIRVQRESCQVDDLTDVKRCLPYYTSKSEDKTHYSLRGWTPISNISAFEASFKLDDLCPKPWRYQTAKALESLSFHGYYASYDGGGYIADLGYNSDTALGVIDDLETNGWIDDRTFAVFVEFTVYEPSSTLFSAAKYLYERYPTGGTKTTGTLHTLMIYYPVDPGFRSFYLTCQLLLLLLIFGLFFVEIVKLYFQGSKYFTHFWNLVNILQLASAVVAMIQYFLKAKYTSDYVRRVKRNPFVTSSSDYIVRWSNLEIWLLSFVVFLVTVKMLRLIKFNHHICHLTHTVKLAAHHLVSYSFVFTATLLAYTQLGTLLFGSNAASYSNMARSLRMLLERLLGNNMYTKELKAENDVTGQLFTFAYSFSIAMILINMFLSILNASYCEVRLLKHGRYPEVELAQFAWKYFLKKGQTFWQNAKSTFKNSNKPKSRLERRKAKYLSVRNADVLKDPDRFFCTKYDEHRSSSYRSEIQSAEECPLLSTEEVRFQKATVDSLDDVDIDLVDEYSSLRDIKKTLLQIGTSFLITKNQWSSVSLNADEDDRDDASSLKSEWSYGSESDQSLFGAKMVRYLKDDDTI